jgi:hypothetical protein
MQLLHGPFSLPNCRLLHLFIALGKRWIRSKVHGSRSELE